MKKFNIKTILIVSLIIVMLGMVGTFSYAYFTATISGNDLANTSVVKSGVMSILFSDGDEVTGSNWVPGSSIVKKFDVTNTGNVDTNYSIYLSELVNNFSDKSDLVYTLTGDNGVNLEKKEMLGEKGVIASNISISVGSVHKYELKIEFLNSTSENQDDNKGKVFSAKIRINDALNATGPIVDNLNGSYSSILSNGATVSWNQAVDSYVDASELKYYLCKSVNDDIAIDSCKSNYIVAGNNITSYNVSGLNSDTTYYFGVVVEDSFGLSSLYKLSSMKTSKDVPTVWGEHFEIKDKTDLVGINYSTWFNYMHSKTPTMYNVTNILNGQQSWGAVGDFHYWAEPALGYYDSTDKSVVRKHLTDIYNAGIDFIILDNTNVLVSWIGGDGVFDTSTIWYKAVTAPMYAILDTAVEMRNEGLPTPYFVNWVRTNDGYTVLNVMDNMFTSTTYDPSLNTIKYVDLWVYWNDLPFYLITSDQGNLDRNLTARVMWGLQSSTSNGEWTYIQKNNASVYGKNNTGALEQMGVSVAMQQTRMTNTSTATGRNHGLTLANQWQNAYTKRPKFVTLTWWNEWGAERLSSSDAACSTYCFTDNYNQEYSRDIEPMKNGHGDTYYQWTKNYVNDYKNHTGFVKYVEPGY